MNVTDQLPDVLEKKSKNFSFHPKRWLKSLQYRLHKSPYLYLLFCFLAPIFIMFCIYLTRGLHPLGNGSPLVLDMNAQYVYFFSGLRNLIYGDASSILYSFSRSLGGEFLGMYAYYLASPFSYIVALFPADRMQEAVLTIMLLKAGFCGLSFGYYLHKHTKNRSKITIFTFSLLYALTSYAVCQQSNTMWIDALIWLPLLALGIEQLILNRKYKLYTVSLAVTLICNYYIGYMLCIFSVIFFFYSYFSKTPEEINPRKEKQHFLRACIRFGIFSLLAAAIAAFMLIVALYSLQFGKSDFSTPNWALKPKFEILDFLTRFLPGAYDTFEPAGLPFVYCGLITLILIPIYFLAKKISAREKIASAALIAVFFISFITNPIDLIWHGFSTPNWLNARYSFLFCFILLILAYKGFGNLKKTSEKFILAIGAFILLFIAVAQKFEMDSYINSEKKLPTFGSVWFSIFFTIALVVIICLRIQLKSNKSQRAVSLVMAAVIAVELFANGAVCFDMIHKDVLFTTYSSFYDFTEGIRPTVESVKEYDKSFYRMESLHHRQHNDNFALAMRGISNSTSTLNAKAINLVNKLGYTARTHLTKYNGGTPFSDSLFGIKYVIARSASQTFDGIYNVVDELTNDSYKVYENPYALSIAYGVSKDLLSFDLENQNNVFQRYNNLAAAMLGEDETLKIFKGVSNLTTVNNDCKETKFSTTLKYAAPEDSEGSFSLIYTAPKAGNYYFYPSNIGLPESCSIRVNNGIKTSFLERDTNHVFSLGYFEKDADIRITFYIKKGSITFSTRYSFLHYFDSEVYNDTMQKLMAQPQFKIDDESTDDHLFGTIETQNNAQTILTTIPFDEGWEVYVDGEEVRTYMTLDALMAFEIDSAGDHTLELKYAPDVYLLGFIVSIVGIVAFLGLCLTDFVLKKTLFKKKRIERFDDYWVLEDFEESTIPALENASAPEEIAKEADGTDVTDSANEQKTEE